MKILVIGSGAREHALCWRMRKSPSCTSLYCAPGNAGITEAICLPNIGSEDIDAIVDWCVRERPGLVVVGPDAALEKGISDRLEAESILVFGPTRMASKIEWSKAFMKDLCTSAGIPTARYGRFTNLMEAKNFIESMNLPIVVKADGLALGKGVLICPTHTEALQASENMLSGSLFGQAGAEIVVEEFLQGFEVSYFALVDGNTVTPLASAQDHKRVGDGDRGPNTGGMGAVSPAPGFTPEIERIVLSSIIQPLADALVAQGTPYRGVVFAGLMIQDGKPIVIEFNARFGDPETQSLMARWRDDPVPWLLAVAQKRLRDMTEQPDFSEETALGVVMAAKGYPDAYAKRTALKVPDVRPKNVSVFHAGTIAESGQFLNGGGRTLTVVATGPDARTAQQDAYGFVRQVDWPDGFYRNDIGWRALKG